ncbi:MAG: hypothetical protein WCJ17_01560 [bacterium]
MVYMFLICGLLAINGLQAAEAFAAADSRRINALNFIQHSLQGSALETKEVEEPNDVYLRRISSEETPEVRDRQIYDIVSRKNEYDTDSTRELWVVFSDKLKPESRFFAKPHKASKNCHICLTGNPCIRESFKYTVRKIKDLSVDNYKDYKVLFLDNFAPEYFTGYTVCCKLILEEDPGRELNLFLCKKIHAAATTGGGSAGAEGTGGTSDEPAGTDDCA